MESQPKVLSVPLPEYTIDKRPNFTAIGSRIDKVIEENFDVKNIIVRAISSMDHPQYSLEKLVNIILEKDTDKYDQKRKGVAHEEFEPYQADLQAGPFEIDEKTGSFFGGIMRNFYENAPLDRGSTSYRFASYL